jgi:hypothetical protein
MQYPSPRSLLISPATGIGSTANMVVCLLQPCLPPPRLGEDVHGHVVFSQIFLINHTTTDHVIKTCPITTNFIQEQIDKTMWQTHFLYRSGGGVSSIFVASSNPAHYNFFFI